MLFRSFFTLSVKDFISITGPYEKSRRAAVVNKKQMRIPQTVGIKKERRVHFRLPVSFLIVRQVVAQGQCIRENKIVLTAVIQVQPFAVKAAAAARLLFLSDFLPPYRS